MFLLHDGCQSVKAKYRGQTMRGESTPIPRKIPIINVPLAPTFRIYDYLPTNIRNMNHWIAYACDGCDYLEMYVT